MPAATYEMSRTVDVGYVNVSVGWLFPPPVVRPVVHAVRALYVHESLQTYGESLRMLSFTLGSSEQTIAMLIRDLRAVEGGGC